MAWVERGRAVCWKEAEEALPQENTGEFEHAGVKQQQYTHGQHHLPPSMTYIGARGDDSGPAYHPLTPVTTWAVVLGLP